MVFAEEIRKIILKLADERGPEQTFLPSDVAQAIDKNNWHELIEQVKFVADVLVDEGKIIVRKKAVGTQQSELSKPKSSTTF